MDRIFRQVYDLTLVSGEGSVDVDIYAEYGESMETKNLYLGENCTDGKEYKNLVLPNNAQITLDDNMELRLTPSEHIQRRIIMNITIIRDKN